MKKTNNYYLILSMFVAVVFIFASCTKEGPAGHAGADGTNGENGINGQDGTTTCIQCHDNSQVNFAKQLQWEASGHAMGGNFERNGEGCAVCHTSQGFLERMASGEHVSSMIPNPNPPNCYTCHDVHSDYETTDWSLTYAEPVTLWFPVSGASIDLGSANLCANCHQVPVPEPMPVPGGGNVSVPSPYWGPHHGPVANMIAGAGGYEVGEGYGINSFHATNIENSCITCHMADAYGVQAGGHNMGVTYEYHGHDAIYTVGCVGCHTDPSGLETKIEVTMSETAAMLNTLQDLLFAQGVMDSSFHVVPGEMTADQAGGVYNFLFVKEDASMGIHNYMYSKTLLENSIESLQ